MQTHCLLKEAVGRSLCRGRRTSLRPREHIIDRRESLAIPTGELSAQRIGNLLHLATNLRDLGLMGAEIDNRLSQFVIGAVSDVTHDCIGDDLLNAPAMLVDPAGLGGHVPTGPANATVGVGQNCGEALNQIPLTRVGALFDLGPHDVEAPVQHAPQVGEVGLLLIGLTPPIAQFVE